MDVWEIGEQIVVDADGHPIECDVCPCEIVPPPTPCCDGGPQFDAIYIWGYFSDGGHTPGCLPASCSIYVSGVGSPNLTYGEFTGGTFTWNEGDYSTTGAIGCTNARISGVCASAIYGQIEIDFGSGYQPPTGFSSSTDLPSGCPVPDLGCQVYDLTGGYVGPSNVGYYLTTRDPSTGILCPDGSIIPTTFTFNLMLGLTTYSCTMVFAANDPSFQDGLDSCYRWLGYLVDCTGNCAIICMEYLTDISAYGGAAVAGWALVGKTAVLPTAYSPCRFYVDVGCPAPGSGNAIDDWQPCSGVPNPTPMWSLT